MSISFLSLLTYHIVVSLNEKTIIKWKTCAKCFHEEWYYFKPGDKLVIIYRTHSNTSHSPLVLTREVIACLIKHWFWWRTFTYQRYHFLSLFLFWKENELHAKV